MTRLRAALWPLALAGGIGAGAVIATSDHLDDPVVRAVVTVLVAWSFVGSGLVAWRRQPRNRFGALMVAVGFGWLLTAAVAANGSFPYTLGLFVQSLVFAVLAHVFLAFPSGRLESPLSRALVLVAYADVTLLQVPWVLFYRPQADGCADCPANEALVSSNDGVARALTNTGRLVGLVLAVAVVAIFVRRWRAASPVARRATGPVLVAAGTSTAFVGLYLLVSVVSPPTGRYFYDLALLVLATVPLAFAAGLVRLRFARSAVGDVVVELGAANGRMELRDALRRALGDPTLRLAYWIPEREGFVDAGGEPVTLPGPGDAQVATMIERGGERIAALIHDASLRDEPDVVDAASATAALALENERGLAALTKAEARNRALLEAIPDLMFRIGLDGTYRAVKADDERDLARPATELIGRNIHEVLPKDVADRIMACAREAEEAQTVRTVEYDLTLDGVERSWEARVVPSGDDEVLLIVRDFTERKHAEEALRASRQRIVEAGDIERRRLERNLHDGAQQRLVALSLALRLARSNVERDPEKAKELLAAASTELGHALEELRELARGIHPAVLGDRGLGPALEALAARTPLPVDVEADLPSRLPGNVEAAAYYVVSESLANVVKYANASSAVVRIARDNGRAVIEVEDDGVGGADPSRGSGLRGLADRVEALDGRFRVESERGRGTRVVAEIPCG